MRKISRSAAAGLAALASGSGVGLAQEGTSAAQPIIIPSQSSVYNQNSVYLPTPPSVNGQDIIRGAGGTSCQTAVASAGPYVDMGVIGSEDVFERSTAALYGRVVVPLGRRAKRVDCTKLYELEIARMQVELEMLRLTSMMPMPTADGMLSSNTDEETDAPKGFTLGEGSAATPEPAPAATTARERTPVAATTAQRRAAPPPTPVVHRAEQSDRPAPVVTVYASLPAPAPVAALAPVAAPVAAAVSAATAEPEAPSETPHTELLTAEAPASPAVRPSADQPASPPDTPAAAQPAVLILAAATVAAPSPAETAPAPAARVTPAAVAIDTAPDGNGYYAQLGAFSTLERARIQMKASVRQLGSAAAGAEVRPVERDARTLYRVLLGPMTQDAATATCARLTNGCFVSRG